VRARARTKTLLAWSLWLATFGCCAGGLLAALLWIRPLTLGLLARGAGTALMFPLGYATIGLVLSLRRPAAAAGRPGQLRRRAAPMGASDRLRRHPAAAASRTFLANR
jgi:hypothetical protein